MEVLQSLVPMTMGFNNKPCLFSLFSLFSTMGYFCKTLAKWGWGRLPRSPTEWASRLQWFPAICSNAIPEASTPGTAEGWEKRQKWLKTYQGFTVTVGSNPTKFQTSVINIKKVTVHYILIMLGTLILKIWLQDFLHRYCGVLATFENQF